MISAREELRRISTDCLRRIPSQWIEPATDDGWASYTAERDAVVELMEEHSHPDYDESWRP